MERILVAVDGSPGCERVIDACADMARFSQAEIILLAVREREFARGIAWERQEPADIAERVAVAKYTLRQRGLRVRAKIPMALAGRVAEEIVHVAREARADLIVVGYRRRSQLGALIFGSVGQKVMRLADIPVFVVPPRTVRARDHLLPWWSEIA